MARYHDLTKILPHNYPMILIDEVIYVDLPNKSLTATVTITEDKVFYDETIQGISPLVGIEFMAQTIGCYSYFKRKLPEPEIGFLLGTRSYTNALEYFKKDETYTIKVFEVYSEDKIVAFDCIIYDNKNEECANATINAYQSDDAKQLLIG